MVDSTVDSKDNKEEKTREVADIRNLYFNMSENIKKIWFGGWRHSGGQG